MKVIRCHLAGTHAHSFTNLVTIKCSLKIPPLCSDLHVGPGDEQHNSLTLIAGEQSHSLFPVLDVFPIYLENK